MPARPYPLDRWPKLSRTQTRALNACLRQLETADQGDAVACAQQLLGAKPELELLLPETCTPGALAARLHAPVVAFALEHLSGRPELQVVLECPPSSAALLADRTLGGDGSLGLSQAGQRPDDMTLGALAYLVARVLGAARTSFVLRSQLASSAELVSTLGDGEILILPLDVRIAGQLAPLRLLCPLALGNLWLDARRRHQQQAWLDGVPLSLWADAGGAVLDAASVAALGVGDVLVLDHCGLGRSQEHFEGKITLRIEGSRFERRCHAAETTLVVALEQPTEEMHMTTGRLSEATPANVPSAQLASDTPIELRVELARFSLCLGELAQLGPGQVLSTGRRIGESVTLRAADRAIAEGELVDVDGEVGVRILKLLRS
ncbi:MAG TPA: type III secretion system cytoplasmic ring protein SctQ [Polyangiales bacterium]